MELKIEKYWILTVSSKIIVSKHAFKKVFKFLFQKTDSFKAFFGGGFFNLFTQCEKFIFEDLRQNQVSILKLKLKIMLNYRKKFLFCNMLDCLQISKILKFNTDALTYDSKITVNICILYRIGSYCS